MIHEGRRRRTIDLRVAREPIRTIGSKHGLRRTARHVIRRVRVGKDRDGAVAIVAVRVARRGAGGRIDGAAESVQHGPLSRLRDVVVSVDRRSMPLRLVGFGDRRRRITMLAGRNTEGAREGVRNAYGVARHRRISAHVCLVGHAVGGQFLR